MFYKDKIRVLQVLPSLNSGGVERGTLEIANSLSSRDIVSYIASSEGRMIRHDNPNIIHIKLNLASKNPLIMIRNIFELVKIIRKYDINIIHARSRAPAWSSYFAAKITRVKFITTFHGVYNFKSYLKKFYNSVMVRSDHLIAVSNYVKNHIELNYKRFDSIVIHRGVDTDYFNPDNIDISDINDYKSELGLDINYNIMLIPSRITRWKGHLYLIDIISKMKSKIYCLIVGDVKSTEYLNEISRKIEEYDLVNYIKILPNQSDMPKLYSISDIVISTSQEAEAFGRTIIEAQSMKKIVISTEIGGATETIINNKTGFFIPLNNSKRAADIIDDIINMNNSDKKLITENARVNIINNFSTKKMTDDTVKLYEQIIQNVSRETF